MQAARFTSLYISTGSGNLRNVIQALVNFDFIFLDIVAADNAWRHD